MTDGIKLNSIAHSSDLEGEFFCSPESIETMEIEMKERRFFELGNTITDNKCREQILDMLDEVMNDVMQVFDFGAKKHPDSGDTPNFLTPNGNKCSRRVRGNSCLHHAADTREGITADHESGLHPALHGISSLAIMYIRQKRGIVHPEDE